MIFPPSQLLAVSRPELRRWTNPCLGDPQSQGNHCRFASVQFFAKASKNQKNAHHLAAATAAGHPLSPVTRPVNTSASAFPAAVSTPAIADNTVTHAFLFPLRCFDQEEQENGQLRIAKFFLL